MKAFAWIILFQLVLSSAAIAQDKDRKWVTGVDLVSNYVAAGVSLSGGRPSLRGYAAFRRKGIYGGVSIADVDLAGDRTEVDLYVGFAKQFDSRFLLDASYVRYFFDSTGNCCGEGRLKATYALRKNLAIQGFAAYNHSFGTLNRRATIAYGISNNAGVSATYGRSDKHRNAYWDVGTSVALTKRLSLDLRYYGATAGDEGVVVRLSAATFEKAITRLLLSPFQR